MSTVVPPPQHCETCTFWSQWLSTTGDCMHYALARRDALIVAEDMEAYRRDWPQRPALDTQASDTCADWKAARP
jgi:hypothetical protein